MVDYLAGGRIHKAYHTLVRRGGELGESLLMLPLVPIFTRKLEYKDQNIGGIAQRDSTVRPPTGEAARSRAAGGEPVSNTVRRLLGMLDI